jgi:tetratricopeptide (TPR) repeat protein
MLQFTLALTGVIACALAMVNGLRIGQARTFIKGSRTLETVTEAVQLSPRDPEVYRARGAVLSKRREFDLAVEDLKQAIELRPRDYKLWIELAKVLDKRGDTSSALIAVGQARSLAPFYFAVHWETAILEEKLGRHEEAFKEFRAGALTAPQIRGPLMERAWNTFGGDCGAVQVAMDPQTTQEHLALARFFMHKQRPVETIGLLRLIGHDLSNEDRRELIQDFLNAKQFPEAYEMWAWGRVDRPTSHAVGTIADGGFESERLSHEVGFDWFVDEIPGVSVTIDKQTMHSGMSSLRLNWNGAQNPSDNVILQLVLVKPNTRYELTFVARAQNLVTGGEPIVTIVDVNEKDNKNLAQSSALPLHNTGWQYLSLDFTTEGSTRAIRIALQRRNCSEQSCPIFGTLWLDDFRLSAR